MNLATNAVQSMRNGGKLRISLRIAPSTDAAEGASGKELVTLSISDDGIGIPPEVLDRMYDPFFTTKTSEGGSGLGLSLVHAIVSDMGGHSRGINRGPRHHLPCAPATLRRRGTI